MPLFEWDNILSDGAEVIYSNLASPDNDRDEIDREVAAVRLKSEYIIDVEWDHANSKYLVTIFRGSYENQYNQLEAGDVGEVITIVREWSMSYSANVIGVIGASDAGHVNSRFNHIVT